MKTIPEILKSGCIAQSWIEVTYDSGNRSGGRCEGSYKFSAGPKISVSGDVFGDEKHVVSNVPEVLYGLAKGFGIIHVLTEDGYDFHIYNVIIE